MGKRYVGRTPDSDSSVVPKSYADTQAAALLVTTDYVNAQVATVSQPLVNQAYIDNADGQLAHKTSVDAADALCVPATALNVAGGVAGLDSTGMVQTAQIPVGVPREYKAFSVDASLDGTINLGPGGLATVTSASLRESMLAYVDVPDPGWPWIPQAFAMVQAGNPTADFDPGRTVGTNNWGLLTVLPPSLVSNQVYSVGLCTATYRYNYYRVLPYAAANQTPVSVPPIVGALRLILYGCCWTGSEYTFSGNGLKFWANIFPAAGG